MPKNPAWRKANPESVQAENDIRKERRAWWKLNGFCPRCGGKPREGLSSCAACLRFYRKTAKRKFARAKAEGRCRRCQSRATNGEFCHEHYQAHKAYVKASYYRKKRMKLLEQATTSLQLDQALRDTA